MRACRRKLQLDKCVCVCVFSYLRQAVQLHGALHRHVPTQVGELDLDELAGVQRAMPVPAQRIPVCTQTGFHLLPSIPSHPPACAHGFGQYHSSSVDRLKDALKVDPSGDFPDQNWSDSFGAKLLVDAEKIDLNHFLFSKHQAQ